MTSFATPLRELSWNGIRLRYPNRWEASISAATHILFEDDFHPVLEVRWQKKEKKERQSDTAKLQKIAKESGLETLELLPPHWKKLNKQYGLKLLGDRGGAEAKAAILLCKECGCTILLYFFDSISNRYQSALNCLLSSIRCHDSTGSKTSLWAVQDFQVTLPKTFVLSGHNFGAGLTRLSFTDSGLTMHLCRLAGASERLRSASMCDLINLLGDLNISKEELNISGNTQSHNASPSILQQIRMRLKRKLPFHRVSLRHHPESDRLTGLFFFDKKPIPEDLSNTILNSYEISPL